MTADAYAPDSITAGVLAGGGGLRLGGADKGLLEVGGETLIARVLRRLRPQVRTILISANRNATTYARCGYPVIPDEAGRGPLAGIAALLERTTTDWLLFVPVDAVLLPDDLAARLWREVASHGAKAAVVHDGVAPVPVCGLLARSGLALLHEQLARGRYAVHEAMARLGAVPVDFSDWPREFWSLNTEEERARIERWLRDLDTDSPGC